MYLTKSAITRFETFFEKAGNDECWNWQGHKDKRGYGDFSLRQSGVERKTYSAHRFAWAISNQQDIQPGKMICHTCDNPSCVNPKHLYLGTGFDNNSDTVKRGRAKRKTGSSCSWAKLTEQDVLDIRKSTECQHILAKKYGVHQSQISRIKSGDRNSWACVKNA
jgi:hypothetical protein